VTRLKSERGLPALPKLFKDVQFAGRGHEVSRELQNFLVLFMLLNLSSSCCSE